MSQRCYTPEFADQAVEQVIERGHSVQEVAARLGVSGDRLYKWVKSVRPSKEEQRPDRLLDAKIAESEAERARERKTQIGTGDRSAKIRTYNFPQNRVTDHRIGLTLYRLGEILDGDLEEMTAALRLAEQEERMEAQEE